MIYTFIHLRCFPDGPVYGGRFLVLNYGLSKFIRYKGKLENLGHFKYHDIHFTSLAFSSIWLTCWMKNFKYSEIPKLTRLTRFLDDLWISPPLYIIRIWRLLTKIESAKQHWTPSKFNVDPRWFGQFRILHYFPESSKIKSKYWVVLCSLQWYWITVIELYSNSKSRDYYELILELESRFKKFLT